MLGSEFVLKCLELEGVDTLFGYPGGAVIPLFDALYKDPRFKLYRPSHEQGGTHAADGYARATGKVGVMIATSGPGLTNTVTGIANAYMDSIPMVVISGQVGVNLLGKTSFQEVDTTGVTMPITKHNFLVTSADKIGPAIQKAFQIARSGRPGPVVVDITKNSFLETVEDTDYESLPVFADTRHEGQTREIEDVVEAIKVSKKPVIYAGGGILKANASEALTKFATERNIPVVNSIMGLSSFDRNSPLSYGIVGMHGDKETNLLIYESDLVLGLGVRFSDRAIGKRGGFSESAKIVHVDTDPAEFGKNLDTDYTILGDLKVIIAILAQKTEGIRFEDRHYKDEAEEVSKGFMPTLVLEKLMDHYPDDTIVATDVGQHQMWAVRRWRFKYPRTLISSGGLGTMGFGMGAAIGAKLGRPDRPVLLISGDGSFRMDHLELLTASTYDIPITVLIFSNNTLGMVRQWQALFNDRRYSDTDIYDALDIEKLCQAYGVNFLGEPSTIEELEAILENHDPMTGVNVINFILDHNVPAVPMVAAGAAINEVIEDMDY